jgi:hypothetical protein
MLAFGRRVLSPLLLSVACLSAFVCPEKHEAPVEQRPIIELQPDPLAAILKVGESVTISATLTYRDNQGLATVYTPHSTAAKWGTWKTDDEKIARVTSQTNGVVTVIGVAQGTTNLQMTANAQETTTLATKAVPISVSGFAGGIPASASISPTSVEMNPGETSGLACGVVDGLGVAVANPAVSWASNSPNATVNAQTGVVTGVSAGQATISCVVNGTAIIATRVVTIHPFQLILEPANATVPLDGFVTLRGAFVDFRGVKRGDGTFNMTSSDGSAVPITRVSNLDYEAKGNIEGRESTITVTRDPAVNFLPGTGKVTVTRALRPTDLIGTYSKNGSRTASCNPSAFGAGFEAVLNIVADANNPSGILLLEVHPTVTLQWSFLTITPVKNGFRIVTGRPQRDIGGRLYETFLDLDIAYERITRGIETFKLVGQACEESYGLTGFKR